MLTISRQCCRRLLGSSSRATSHEFRGFPVNMGHGTAHAHHRQRSASAQPSSSSNQSRHACIIVRCVASAGCCSTPWASTSGRDITLQRKQPVRRGGSLRSSPGEAAAPTTPSSGALSLTASTIDVAAAKVCLHGHHPMCMHPSCHPNLFLPSPSIPLCAPPILCQPLSSHRSSGGCLCIRLSLQQ